jgi:hypothetical protein
MKQEFLRLKLNQTLKKDFKQMVEIVPEGILIFDKDDGNKVLFSNAEMIRIVRKFKSEGNGEEPEPNHLESQPAPISRLISPVRPQSGLPSIAKEGSVET